MHKTGERERKGTESKQYRLARGQLKRRVNKERQLSRFLVRNNIVSGETHTICPVCELFFFIGRRQSRFRDDTFSVEFK